MRVIAEQAAQVAVQKAHDDLCLAFNRDHGAVVRILISEVAAQWRQEQKESRQRTAELARRKDLERQAMEHVMEARREERKFKGLLERATAFSKYVMNDSVVGLNGDDVAVESISGSGRH